jgi:hypothetical protein
MFQVFYILAIFVMTARPAYPANGYPVSGAWALVQPSSPQLQVQACKAFERLGLAKITGDAIGGGELIVFNGSKRHNFGGYADEVTPNISIRRLSDKRFDIVDRWISDGEGGSVPGPKRRRYILTIVGADAIEIKEGPYNSARYLRCAVSGEKITDQETAALLRSAKIELPSAVAASIADARNDCDFKSIPPEAVRSIDLNGDGINDYIIDYGTMGCRSFCGSAGCLHEVWISENAGFVRSLNDNIQAVDRIEPHGPGKDIVVVTHGSSCHQVGADACYFRLHWDKSKLTRQQIKK